ncbi:hypothetical protein CUJ83_04200 [Methanocella sp. CWC-04]|uniref:ChrB N-terminal domain-containing protein n=2 Tax=Methanooceanicella nereidis TaxID=2052831 RepID=A0AAP2RAX6_9EURY|nr:hypothetical protein [Methanocella sp. CWC-04]
MRAVGAISIHNGVWVLPHSSKSEQFMNELRSYVNDHEGNASIFIAKAFGSEIEAGLIDTFIKNIDQDYVEFIDKCDDFLKELETEIEQKKFTFAELDENEEELHKLTSWLRKIRARDYFNNKKSQDAASAFDSCRQRLQTFARSVYANEGIDVPDNEITYKDE